MLNNKKNCFHKYQQHSKNFNIVCTKIKRRFIQITVFMLQLFRTCVKQSNPDDAAQLMTKPYAAPVKAGLTSTGKPLLTAFRLKQTLIWTTGKTHAYHWHCVDMPPIFSDTDIQNTPTRTFKNSTPLSTLAAQISCSVYYLAWSFPQSKRKF